MLEKSVSLDGEYAVITGEDLHVAAFSSMHGDNQLNEQYSMSAEQT